MQRGEKQGEWAGTGGREEKEEREKRAGEEGGMEEEGEERKEGRTRKAGEGAGEKAVAGIAMKWLREAEAKNRSTVLSAYARAMRHPVL
eukprot:1946740-Rhodomonas_salina.2